MADRPSGTAIAPMSTGSGTVSGNRGLMLEEPLIFEQGMAGRTAVDLPEVPQHKDRLGGLRRQNDIGLPGLSEPQVVRHFTRLSQKNYAIDMGVYPLGSCTMKYNPRACNSLAMLPQFLARHPSAPCTVETGCNGCRSPMPGRRATFSLMRGLCFMVHEPSG